MQTTSATLLQQLKSGGVEPRRSEAWSRFVHLYSPMLYAWARRMGLQAADAADLVQDVFATLVEKLPEFDYDNQQSFRAWLCTVTRNKWRTRKRRAGLTLKTIQELEEVAAPNGSSIEDLEFHRHMVGTILPTLQEHFQPATWQAFWKHVVEGEPASQIAKELGIDVNMVYVAKCRVLAKLHKELDI